MTQENIRYEVFTEEDDDGNIILPFPLELLEKMGWKEGDTLEFAQNVDGTWIIKKVVK
jgi:bifunctional DNA-binding transcriptional regulator/antitoxin component of YhaV-PrlF toxin-antitoxin module